MKCNEIAAEIHAFMCEDPRFGYTQGSTRWGTGAGVVNTINIGGRKYTLNIGDMDCSSSCIVAWRKALEGTDYEGALDGATYTGNMRSVFVGSGLFEWKPMSFLAEKGDLYLNETKHVGMCQSQYPDIISEFLINEKGGIVGGQQGDQTGRESISHAYWTPSFGWDGILHYNGKADEDMPSADEIAKAVWKKDIHGMSAGERLYLDNKQLFDRKDYSGRGINGCTPIERITWLAAKVDKLQETCDAIIAKLDE